MKSSLFSRIIFATLVLALTTSAFAASDSHKSSFEISAATQVNGTTTARGDYTAQWEGSGPTVQVNIMQGKKVVATAPAQVVALDSKASDTHAEVLNGSQWRARTQGTAICGEESLSATGNRISQSADKSPQPTERSLKLNFVFTGSRQLLPCFQVPS